MSKSPLPNEHDSPDHPTRSVEQFQWLIGLFGLLLFGVTWRLWTPQTVFPQVPFFSCLVSTPTLVDWVAGVGLTVGLMGLLTRPWYRGWAIAGSHVAMWLFWVSLSVLIALDQHRLQPWAYQLWILAAFSLTLPKSSQLTSARWLLISVYAYSSLNRVDYQFVNTVGLEMVDVWVRPWSVSTTDWGSSVRWMLGICLASIEFLMALLLSIPNRRSRLVGVVLAVAFHLGLLWTLGPFGLQHQPPVLLWNLFFLVQVLFLFDALPATWPRSLFCDGWIDRSLAQAPRPASGILPCDRGALRPLGWLIAGFVLVFPLTSFFGIADHWPSWELYSPRSSRAVLFFSEGNWGPELAADRNSPQTVSPAKLSFNQWSLQVLGVPVYPQQRFQVGCSLAVAAQLEASGGRPPNVVLESVSNRWDGSRRSETIRGMASPPRRLEDAANRYWFNTWPRPVFQLPSSLLRRHQAAGFSD